MNDFHLFDLFNIIMLINHFKNKYRLLVTENSVSAVCLCVHGCKQLGYLFAAVQDGAYCFCGNTFGSKTVCFPIVANTKNALVLEN